MRTLRSLAALPLVRRLLAGTGSNAYAQATTIAIQLLSLPLFLSHWSLERYGQWLILSSVPAYLAMADVGMVTAAGNRMTMLVGENNPRFANTVFQSALAFVLSVCAVAMLLVLVALAAWPAGAEVTADGRWAVALLCCGVVVALISGLPEAVYRATQRYAISAALSNTIRLLEWAGGIAGLAWNGSFTAVAFGALVPRLLLTLGWIAHAARSTPAFRWNFRDARLAEVKRCAGPAISFMAFPAANALNFQGMTLVAASVLGPAATVVFNTYRTMARVTVQATATFSNALWPEFSRIFGQRNLHALGVLYRRAQGLGLALAAGASLVVYLIAPTVLHAWAKGKIEFSPSLMLVSMLYAAAAGGWHVSRVLLLSTNEHQGLAWPYLALSVAWLALAWGAARAFGLVGLMGAMLALELAMLWFCAHLSRRLLAGPPRPAQLGAA